MSFPLIPKGRLVGLSFGGMRSYRRGSGSDVIGSRPYQVGDDVHSIDWAASARWSSARASDEFIVRERYADEAPRVVIVSDRRPEMSIFGAPLPWLDKPAAIRHAADLIVRSALLSGGFVGYLDHAGGEPWFVPPRGGRRFRETLEARLADAPFDAPPGAVELALAHLAEHRRSVSPGSFVFVLSDLIPPPSDDVWLRALEHRWDVVPVVLQDPVWERSFPDVAGIEVPLRNPRTGRLSPALLRAGEVASRRAANEERFAGLVHRFRGLELDPVVLSSSDPVSILTAFLDWAEARRTRRVART